MVPQPRNVTSVTAGTPGRRKVPRQVREQEMLRVDHSSTPEQLAARGREAETRALARAVRWHTENRIIVRGNRTVVFE